MEQTQNMPKTNEEFEKAIRERIAEIAAFPPSRMEVQLVPELISADLTDKSAWFSFPVEDWMLNTVDTLHGGTTCFMFDMAMGILLRKYTYRDARTLELQVNYAAPLTLADGRVKVRCQITALSRKIAHFYAAAYGAGDEPAATATGIFYLLSRPAQA